MSLVFILISIGYFGQRSNYTRHYKEPKKLSTGTTLILGGIVFTAAPIISEVTSTNYPFKEKGLTPNKMALSCGISLTITGLIAKLAE